MAGTPSRARRSLALVACGLLVVGALGFWWVTRMRSLEAESERTVQDRAEGDLRDLRRTLESLEGALDRMERERGAARDTPSGDRPSDRPSDRTPDASQAPTHDPVATLQAEASAPHIRALIQAYEKATDDATREQILDRLTYAHSMYAETHNDLQFLPFFREVVRDAATATQRRYAVIALHGVSLAPVVDFFQELLGDPHPEVRFYAAEALPWVRGEQADRARGLLEGALDHEDAGVRRISALSLGIVVADPVHGASLLRRLRTETDASVLESLVFAVRRLYPADADARVRALLPDLDRAQVDRIEGFLR